MDEQSLAAIASVIVAIGALIFSIVSFKRQQDRADQQQDRADQQQDRAEKLADQQQKRAEKLTVDGVKPLLWIQGQNYTHLKSVQLKNHGLGPAVIKLARFKKGAVTTDNLVELFSDLGGAAWVTYVDLPPKRVIAVGADISLIKQSIEHLRGQGINDKSAFEILGRIQKEKKGIEVYIEYLDIFGNEIDPVDFII